MTSTIVTTNTTVLDASLTRDTINGVNGANGVDPTLDSGNSGNTATLAGDSVGERLARRAHELTFGVPMLLVLTAILRGYLHPRTEDDEGASTAEWVIGVAIAAALAIAVGAIIVSKVTAKANSIDLG